MSARTYIPKAVLAQELTTAIGGRIVRAAVFTTFSFDPGFFELHVLPVLFDQSFSQADKVRRIQLEDALRSIAHLAVYYDRNALAQDGEPAQLDYRRIDVSRPTGYFHPKVVLLLVDEPFDADIDEAGAPPTQALIVGILSANLTRAGCWENVECAHIEEIKDKDVHGKRCSFRPDLLSLIRRLRAEASDPDEDHAALDAIHGFLRRRTDKRRFERATAGRQFFTRIYCGQDRASLSEWLAELRIRRHEWNLEVVSPFFDPTGVGPLGEIMDVIQPRETRIYLPTTPDGGADVHRATYDAIAEIATWSKLPGEIVNRGRGETSERLPPRRVHAKLFRLWNQAGHDLLLVGSANLTSAGHSHATAGNLEAVYLVDVSSERYLRRWWLEPIDEETITRYAEETPTEDEGLEPAVIDLSIRYDWATGELAYRLHETVGGPIELATTAGQALHTIQSPRRGKWIPLPKTIGERAHELLQQTSFLLIRHGGGSWRVLVREEKMSHRPSLLTQLTPEEILQYWALLTPDQRAAFIEERLGLDAGLEGLPLARRERLVSRNTLFDRFAGIYHAFGCLERYVETAIEEGRERDAEARLFGAKYDSLPSLLEKVLAREERDPVIDYVTFLCAQQLYDTCKRRHRAFFSARRAHRRHVDTLLAHLPELRSAVPVDGGEGREFLEWFEESFVAHVEGSAAPAERGAR